MGYESASGANVLKMSGGENLVGLATNVQRIVLSFGGDYEWLAAKLSFKSEKEMFDFLQYAIKVGTDIFKTSVDYMPIKARLQKMQKSLRDMGIRAPWTGWIRDDIAYRHAIPPVAEFDSSWDEWTKTNYVPEDSEKMNGCVSHVVRYVHMNMQLPPQITQRPLSFYREWAIGPQNETEREFAKTVARNYAMRLRSVNFSDPESWQEFINDRKQYLAAAIAAAKLDPYRAANCLWHVSHDGEHHSDLVKEAGKKRGKLASLVFVLMPQEAKRIIKDKPGLVELQKKLTREVTALGLHKTIPNYEDGMELPINIVVMQDGQTRRVALVAESEPAGYAGADSKYPPKTVAVLDTKEYVSPGKWIAKFFRLGDKATRAVLVPAMGGAA